MKKVLALVLLMATNISVASPINEPDFKAPIGPKTCWLIHGYVSCITW